MQWAETAPTELREAVSVDLRADGAVVVLDRSGTCVGVDDGAEQILGTDPLLLLGRPGPMSSWRWCDADGSPLPDAAGPVATALSSGEPVVGRVLGLDATGEETGGGFAWVEVSAYPLRGPSGAVEGVAAALRDVSLAPAGRLATTALARSLRALATASLEDEARFRALAESATDVVFQTDVVGRCVWVSPSVTDVLGWTPDQVVGRSLVPLQHPGDREVANERRLAALSDRGGGHERLELRYATAGGAWRWMSVLSRPVRDATGRVTGGLTALRDIQDEVDRRAEQRWTPRHDALTGLADRDTALHALTRALGQARDTGRWVGVLYVDVDRFRDVNEVHGPDVGDRLLVEVGGRLAGRLRDSDVVARLGADEFLVVLAAMRDGAHAEQRARALLAAVAEPGADGLPAATVSIGVRADDGSGAAGQVLRDAEGALRRAKDAGRNRVSL
jgi:diguanylate cyclase (GGDEF)-like protein/PAS domain S-box-containing protein